jgi:NAD(P)-dependent dehydrogenase (short-subunit alcohol dehydrogenase family)
LNRLENRIALVTGGSRGIGRAAAEGLADEGAAVVLVGRDSERVLRSAAELAAKGHTAVGYTVDVTDPGAVRELPGKLEWLGPVDILVNCAGVMSDRKARMTLRTPHSEWRRVMATNLDGPFNLISGFVPGMVERRWGRVINVSACLGRMSGPGTSGGLASYRVSKGALNALTKNLAAELGNGRRGVLVDAVCPGHCRTDMGGPDAPRSAEEGADTIVWLATRSDQSPTGLLWEDREIVPW